MHDVGTHESNELEKAVLYLRCLVQQMQDEESDHRHGDLNAHRVFGPAEEVLYPTAFTASLPAIRPEKIQPPRNVPSSAR